MLRAIYPERPDARPRGRYIHYDYGVSGVQDMLTAWIPLVDIPVLIGGLAVAPGGHLGPPRRARWWEPVPSGLTLHPRAQLAAVAPGPSRLIAVNPGWKHWRPPPATVH